MMEKLLGSQKRGSLFIVSAPAGTGKSTLVQMLLKEFPKEVAKSCSWTTRPPRPGEQEGRDYHFVSREEFEQKIASEGFLEHAEVFEHAYGTSKEDVEALLQEGKHVILVIDTQGARSLEGRTEAVSIFVHPPSLEELQRRLFKRKTETQEVIEERLSWAQKEIAVAVEYDYQIVNDDLTAAYQILRSIFIAEEHKTRR